MLSKELFYQGPRAARAMDKADVAALIASQGLDGLAAIGINMDAKDVRNMMAAMDTALTPLQTTASMGDPIQFLQTFMPGFVMVQTQARKIDELVGKSTIGAWEDEEIVQGVMEPTGVAQLYGDLTNIPFADYNNVWERRTVIRFEEGMRVGTLEEKRANRVGINAAEGKRVSCSLSLDRVRNRVGFFGFNGGANRTYGFLNDPNLPAYVSVANPGGGTTWATKTFLQITADLRTAFAQLRTQSGDTIDPETETLILALPTNAMDRLTVTSDYGNSVRDWLRENYPKTKVVSAPELNTANGGAGVFYLYPERANDSSTDDGRVFTQMVPSSFMVLGVAQIAKGYEEDYSNATAGVMCKRPYLVVRYTGIS